jgi:hypothetical protein
MRRLAGGAVLAVAVAVAACGGDSESAQPGELNASPSGGIDIRGKITDLATPLAGVSMGALVVEGEDYPDTPYHRRAAVRMKDDTVVQRKQGDDIFPASIVDLEAGKRVEIKFTGPVAELDPVQATAGEITLLD